MSLDADYTKIKDYKELDPTTRDAITLNGCLLTGMGEITEKNAPKFYARVHAFELIIGSTLLNVVDEVGDFHKLPTTPAMIKRMIGLKTNVFPMVTDAAFAKRLLRWATETAEREWKAAEQAEAEAAAKAAEDAATETAAGTEAPRGWDKVEAGTEVVETA